MARLTIGILIVLCLFANINSQIYDYCTPYQSNVLTADLPELPNVFNVRHESNHVSSQYTTDSLVVYDAVRRKVSVQHYSQSMETRYIFDYTQNEVHRFDRIPGDDTTIPSCVTQSIVDSPATSQYFGYVQQNSTFMVPGSQYDWFHFSRTGQLANGTDTIRGIPVDVYLSCVVSEPRRSNYKVKFYISKSGYQMPYFSALYKQAPVRAEVEGIYYDNNNIKTSFKTVHDYHEFNPSISPFAQYAFDIPNGVFCVNKKNTKPLPNVNVRYAYSEEIVRTKTLTNLKRIYYDSLFQLVRYDNRNTRREIETFFVLDPIVSIHDYSTGIGYHINQNLGNCTRRGLGYGEFGFDFGADRNFTAQSISQGLGISVKIKSPSSFLSLDSNFTFMGERFENEVPVDLFISSVTEEFGNGQKFSSLHEYTFRMPFTAGNAKPRDIPTRFSVYSLANPDYNTQFNYYNFVNDIPDYSVFDTSGCWASEEKVNFRLSFSYRDILTNDQFKNSFVQFMEQFLYAVLADKFNETAMRFTPPKISVGFDGTFYAVSSILPPVPPLDLYKKWEGKWLVGTSFTSKPVASDEDCAIFCNQQTLCMSFDYCPGSGTCYANERHITNDGSTAQTSNCDHYSRTSDGHVAMKSSSQIWTLIQNAVAVGILKIEIPVPVAGGFALVNITATDAVQLVDNTNFGATSILSRFDLTFKNSRYASRKDRFYNGISVDQCAQNCARENAFNCESFHYCYVSGECMTSRTGPTNISDIVKFDPCEIYSRDPLYHYSQFAYAVTPSSKDKKYENINSASECAKLCDVEKSIHCRGFNFCGASGTCFLTETHSSTDASVGQQINLVCTHYSRNFLQDFSYTSSGNISIITAELIVGRSSLEECSRDCVSADGFQCKSFDFCERSRTCLLHSNNRSQVPVTPGDRNSDYCDNYIRDFYFLTNTVVNLSVKKDDNSESVLTGLAITFSIGSIIGGFLIFIYVLPKFTKAK